jgi:type IV secretion system protein VirD4
MVFGGRGGSSESVSEQRRPLLLPQELKELGREKEIILMENTKPILATRICYWQDPNFSTRVLAAPLVPAIDLARFLAEEQRRPLEVPSEENGERSDPSHSGREGGETGARGRPKELSSRLDDLSEEEVMAYVERQFSGLNGSGRLAKGAKQESVAASRKRAKATTTVSSARCEVVSSAQSNAEFTKGDKK